ncbi:MAG TPA: high-affinity branched-chain amino acid ABC transporter permease LivM, partial [Alphaproteobacteria bacterium]|nr:high-affinity branched-chain amino acid ABC transporter permease LivM [Alphaproteobacteria bacterium]
AVVIVPMFGLHLDSENGFLEISTNWFQALTFLAAALALRATVLLSHKFPRPKIKHQAFRVFVDNPEWSVWAGRVMIVIAIALPFLPFVDRRLLDVATLILTYVAMGWGLSIMVGMVGLLDLGYAAFYAIGAYAFSLLAVDYGWSFWAALPVVIAVCCLGALIVGGPILRLRGDYFAIVTLGFAEIVRLTLINWQSLTHGPDGVTGIPRPSVFGMATFNMGEEGLPQFSDWLGIGHDPMQRLIFMYLLLLGFALLVMLLIGWLRRSTFGLAFEAIREDEIAAQAMGINRPVMKLFAYVMAAIIAGIAGAFFAARQGFVSPESFNPMESFIILSIVVLGGMGSRLGVVIAAMVLIGLPELFREFAQYRMLAFGLALVLIMIWRPQGLLAHRRPTQTLTVDKD